MLDFERALREENEKRAANGFVPLPGVRDWRDPILVEAVCNHILSDRIVGSQMRACCSVMLNQARVNPGRFPAAFVESSIQSVMES